MRTQPTTIKAFNLTIGPMEFAERSGWDVIINVNDTMPVNTSTQVFWLPIDQVTFWGYPVFFATKRILDEHFKRHSRILVHCMMGAHRSRMIVYAWLLSRGLKGPAIDELMGGNYTDTFKTAVRQNHIPSDLPLFFDVMNQDREACLAQVMIGLAKAQQLKTRAFGAALGIPCTALTGPPW